MVLGCQVVRNRHLATEVVSIQMPRAGTGDATSLRMVFKAALLSQPGEVQALVALNHILEVLQKTCKTVLVGTGLGTCLGIQRKGLCLNPTRVHTPLVDLIR